MKIIGIIPARYGSSRFPGKPLADIHGKPMIWWVYQQAKKVAELDEVIVATDSQKILDVCDGLGIKRMLTGEHAAANERLHEVSLRVAADIYVCINGDEPLISPDAIHCALPSEADDMDLYYANLVTDIKDPIDVLDPANVKAVFNEKGEGVWASRSPIPFPKGPVDFVYHKTVGVAAFSKKALRFFHDAPMTTLESVEELDMYRFIENGLKVYFKKTDCHSISVDTPRDLDRVRKLITNTPPPASYLLYGRNKWLKHSFGLSSFSMRRAA